MKVEFSGKDVEEWLTKPEKISSPSAAPSHRQVLEGLVDDEHVFILEPGTIRVVPRDEAQAFWKAWWEREKKK